jgi:hypothetical protein
MWSFMNDREWLLGCAMGAGDILGQMAAPNYPEKLPALYREYREAVVYSDVKEGILVGFTSAEDMMRKTRGFYENYVRRMLGSIWGRVHESLVYHYDGSKDNYFTRIEANLKRIDEMLERSGNVPAVEGTAKDAGSVAAMDRPAE